LAHDFNFDRSLREDLDPESCAAHAAHWRGEGTRIFGGCCGTGPERMARLRRSMDEVA